MNMHLQFMASMRMLGRSICGLIGALALAVNAQPEAQTADRIKAAYVYNFAKFVEMTGADDKAIRLCVAPRKPLKYQFNRRLAEQKASNAP